MLFIEDPQNLLPSEIEIDSDIVVQVPAHGIPIHPRSIDRLLRIADSSKAIIAFRPMLPVSSELGLPPYPTLVYIYPQALSNFWKRLNYGSSTEILEGFTKIISETSLEEQLHYFSEYYGQALNPSYIRVVLGNTCNLKCVMCPYHSPLIKPSHTTDYFTDKKLMPWSIMERIAKDCGTERISVVIGNVEEPLLHPNLVDFIQLCCQKGVPKVHLTTNAQLLDESYSNALLKSGLTSIDISIDAVKPETYRKVRGASLERVESNVKRFVQLRDQLGISCVVRTSMIRNQDVTLEEEEQFRKYWLTEVDGVFILNLARYEKNNISIDGIDNSLKNSIQQYMQKAQGRWPCLFPFMEMAILPDGRTYYCIETLFRLGFDQNMQSLGNYNIQSLKDIWSGSLYNQLRRNLILSELDYGSACRNCEMWKSQVVVQSRKDGFEIVTTKAAELYLKIQA